MLLIVGLGNPGKKYVGTRHNVGFRVVGGFRDLHAETIGGWNKKFDALVAEGRIGEKKVALMLPQTFMNASGDAVAQAVQFWKLRPQDVVLVYDDLDLPLGAIRVRASGSSGGHNGVQSVIDRLGSKEIPRIRIGIGGDERFAMPDEKIPHARITRTGDETAVVPADKYVLEPFAPEEREKIDDAIRTASFALKTLIEKGAVAAANSVN